MRVRIRFVAEPEIPLDVVREALQQWSLTDGRLTDANGKVIGALTGDIEEDEIGLLVDADITEDESKIAGLSCGPGYTIGASTIGSRQ